MDEARAVVTTIRRSVVAESQFHVFVLDGFDFYATIVRDAKRLFNRRYRLNSEGRSVRRTIAMHASSPIAAGVT